MGEKKKTSPKSSKISSTEKHSKDACISLVYKHNTMCPAIIVLGSILHPISFVQYYKLPNITIGGYDFQLMAEGQPVPVQFKLRQYSSLTLNASTFEFTLNGELNTSNVSSVVVYVVSYYVCILFT